MTDPVIQDSSIANILFWHQPVLSPTNKVSSDISTSNGQQQASIDTWVPNLDPVLSYFLNDDNISAITNSLQSENLFDINYVLRMLEDLFNTIKQSDRQLRFADAQSAYQSLLNQADEILQAADKRFIGDLCSSIATAVVGGLSIGFGVASLKNAASATSKTKQLEIQNKLLAGLKKNPTQGLVHCVPGAKSPAEAITLTETKIASLDKEISALNFTSQAQSQMTNAVSIAGQAMGGIGKAVGDHAAAGDDAEKTEQEAYQQIYELGRDSLSKVMDAIQQLYDSVVQIMASIEQSRHESNARILQA